MAVNLGDIGVRLETKGRLAEKAKTDTEIVQAVIDLAKSDEMVKYEALVILENIGRPPATGFMNEVIKSVEDKFIGRTVTFDKEDVVRSWLDWTDLCRKKHKLGTSWVFRQAFLSFDFPETKLMHLYYVNFQGYDPP